jgi:3-hydroxymyristoyl/3-hydroxydecanoyl-(acyl carrier protein) dehydratase
MRLDGTSLLEASVEPARARLRFRLEAESPVLAGHFPGEPVLPGVAHLVLAQEAAEQLVGRALAVASLEGFRLRLAVRPGDVVDVSAARTDREDTLRFELRVGGVLSSSGLLSVTDAAAHG